MFFFSRYERHKLTHEGDSLNAFSAYYCKLIAIWLGAAICTLNPFGWTLNICSDHWTGKECCVRANIRAPRDKGRNALKRLFSIKVNNCNSFRIIHWNSIQRLKLNKKWKHWEKNWEWKGRRALKKVLIFDFGSINKSRWKLFNGDDNKWNY